MNYELASEFGNSAKRSDQPNPRCALSATRRQLSHSQPGEPYSKSTRRPILNIGHDRRWKVCEVILIITHFSDYFISLFSIRIFLCQILFQGILTTTFRVKRAIDLDCNKEVAIKMLKLKNEPLKTKKLILEHFLKEVQLLSKCQHKNIVRLLDCSFSGTLIVEKIEIRKASVDLSKIEEIRKQEQEEQQRYNDDDKPIKKKSNICYAVFKLARYGELYKIIEKTDKFSPQLSGYIFKQLIKGKPHPKFS